MDLKMARILGIILDIVIPSLFFITMLLIQSQIRPIVAQAYIEGTGYIFSAVSLAVPFAARSLYLKQGKSVQSRMVGYALYELPSTLGLIYFLIGGNLLHGAGFCLLSAGYFLLLDSYVFGDKNEIENKN